MEKIKAVIADDEEQIRRHLTGQLARIWPELEICAQASNGIEALEAVSKHRPAVVFLDIRMPGLSGMQVAARIIGQCHVVFITAYDQYAVEAFENEAIDFLLKPLSDDRLAMTVARLRQRLAAGRPDADRLDRLIKVISAKHLHPQQEKYLQWIRVMTGDCIQVVPMDQVYYLMAVDKYTTVVTKDKEYIIRKPIKELAAEVDPDRFWRIHRSTIVNVGCIDKVSRSLTGRYLLKLKDLDQTLKVSRSYTHLFKQM